MSRLVIVRPLPIASITASRGTGGFNLATRDPKEVWVDSAIGGTMHFLVDLGTPVTIDTVGFLYVTAPSAGAGWAISGGLSGPAEVSILNLTELRVPDVAGEFEPTSHALWQGAAVTVRYLAVSITPNSPAPLTAGVLVVGRAISPELGQEWGAGRQPIDTGSATALPSGGFAIVEGVRKLLYKWTFGDLSEAETDQMESAALALGETAPGLVIEDASATPGLRRRIHYGLFKRWTAFERRNRRQTRWEIAIEEWI